MIKMFKKNEGIVVMLLPIIILPMICFTYFTLEPMIDVANGKPVQMEYENTTNIVQEPVLPKNPDDDIPVVEYKGFDTFGEIRIPDINLKQKVISSVTADAIEVTCAYLYSSNGFNQVGNTVIIGHNYRNGKLFSNVKKLKVGNKIYLKTNGQEEIEYEIYKVFVTTSSDATFYNRETNGKREITLSTCTDDADKTDNRLIVLAREK